MKRNRHIGLLAGAAIIALLANGCGGPNYKQTVILKGKITKGGQPIVVNPQLGDYARVEATFIAADSKTQPFTVKVGPDGGFTFATNEGKPVPPGKYRVAVRQWEPYPQKDLLGGQFDERNTPVVTEITAATKEVAIDLDKPNG